MQSYADFNALAFAQPPSRATGKIKTFPADFLVDEILGFDPQGEGQHQWVLIRKTNLNTQELADDLAKLAGVATRDVGFSGMKDKQAVTTQWFSIDLAGRPVPDWTELESDQIEICRFFSGQRKLRRGAHSANRFGIRIRNLDEEGEDILSRLEVIKKKGVPNYFGPQRFGHNGNNIQQALLMFEKRRRMSKSKRSLYLSAARSFLFNAILSERLKNGLWLTPLSGDVMMLDGSKRFFQCENIDEQIQQRIEEQDISPSGPLWGRGQLQSCGEVAEFEKDTVMKYPELSLGLENAGLEPARRSLRLRVSELSWSREAEDELVLQFVLPAGGYATSVLRELIQFGSE